MVIVTINSILETIKSFDSVLYVLHVGSSVTETQPRDIDFLVGIVDSQDREMFFAKFSNLLQEKKANNVRVSDDALRFDLDSTTYDVALYHHNHLKSILESGISGTKIEGRLAFWAVKSWLPESFLADIASSKILYEREWIVSPYIEKVKNYPILLRAAIMSRCKDEIFEKVAILSRTSNLLEMLLIRADIAAALVRYAFAFDSVYLRGFKKFTERSHQLSPTGRKLYEFAMSLESNTQVTVAQLRHLGIY